MALIRQLLWVDSGAALGAGVAVLALADWLSGLYALPPILLVAMGMTNLACGIRSGWLARGRRRRRALLIGLVVANATSAVLCLVAALRVVGSPSAFELAHLIGYGLFVGGLAGVEWHQWARLLSAA